jgi:hypothetical protein
MRSFGSLHEASILSVLLLSKEIGRYLVAISPAFGSGRAADGRGNRLSAVRALRGCLKLTRFRGARQAFNGGFSDAQDASALFT